MPADPLPAAEVDAMLARAGLALTEAERATVRDATRYLVEMRESVRPAGRGIEAEPAVTFDAAAAAAGQGRDGR
jgi:hypothetical protein